MCSLRSQPFQRQSLIKLTACCVSVRDLQRLGELQTELAGAADFCATYLHCQLLLMKVGACAMLVRPTFTLVVTQTDP